MSRPPRASIFRFSNKTKSTFSCARRPRLKQLSVMTAMRAGASLALFALFATIFYTGTSLAASTSSTPSSPRALESVQSGAAARYNFGAWLLPPSMFQTSPSLVESINTYASDCSTPKTDFNLGETVCMRATFPTAFLSFRRVTWIDPEKHILDSAVITSNSQTDLFTLPSTATSEIGGVTVDHRGTWRLDLRSFGGSRRATAFFDVHEPSNPRADLQVSAGSGDDTVESGSTTQARVVVYNAGPDPATNIKVSAPSPPGLSLQSFNQVGGSDCGSVCTVASLPSRSQSIFIATYNVTAAAGARISGAVTVTSDTEDPKPANNSDVLSYSVAADSNQTQTCTLTPPPPIVVNGSELTDPNDPSETLFGAVVTYQVDAVGESCAPVQCDVPSGSSFPVGTTNVTCTAASGEFTIFPVTVLDTRALKISLIGANPLRVECHSAPPFADPGATTNNPGITPTAVSTVNPDVPGTYTITYTATDGTNSDTVIRTVNVIDDSPPLITLNGDDPLTDEVETESLTIECHTAFTDPGATAADACDGPAPVSVSSNVDPNAVGTYTITYTATDDHGTPGDPSDDLVATATRTINVVDTTDPTITLNGASPLTIECHTAFTDPGASATDICAGDLDSAIQVSGIVDADTVGAYTLTYTVRDASGNAATVERTVNVVDTTGPAITLNGASSMTVECHTSFTDPGASAADACDNAVPVTPAGSVDVNVPGAYTITYTASDASGNAAVPVTRTVNVVDTTAPVIDCPADIVVNLPANSAAIAMPVNFNVTASDSCSTTTTVTTSHASGSNFPVGTTTVTATATDPSGNTSTCTFKVSVRYLFAGFFSPISNPPMLNLVKAGSAIPVKFSLSGNKGLSIMAAGYPASGVISCNSNDPVAEVTETSTAGNSSLNYDAASDRYHYVWKTESAWANTCRQLVVKLNDGTEHRANFKFK